MSNNPPRSQVSLSGDNGATFLLRWRGRQEGPYTPAVIEAKFASNQIGLLHEISHNGRWITLRDFFAEREAVIRSESQAREEADRRAREEVEQQARQREEQRQEENLPENRIKNDLMQASLSERPRNDPGPNQPAMLKPHRAGVILALGLIGLLVCGPLCIAAWLLGDSDIREMDAGMMDKSGQSMTGTGRTLGVLGSILWVLGVICLIFVR